MRKPSANASSKAEELKRRSELSEGLGNNAPLTYQNEPVKKKVQKKSKPVLDLSELSTVSEFSKRSKSKKRTNFVMNLYEKGAFTLLARRKDMTLQKYWEEVFLKKVIQEAETLGLTEETVKEMYEKGLIK